MHKFTSFHQEAEIGRDTVYIFLPFSFKYFDSIWVRLEKSHTTSSSDGAVLVCYSIRYCHDPGADRIVSLHSVCEPCLGDGIFAISGLLRQNLLISQCLVVAFFWTLPHRAPSPSPYYSEAAGESSTGPGKVALPFAPHKTRSWQQVADPMNAKVAKNSANMSRPGLVQGESYQRRRNHFALGRTMRPLDWPKKLRLRGQMHCHSITVQLDRAIGLHCVRSGGSSLGFDRRAPDSNEARGRHARIRDSPPPSSARPVYVRQRRRGFHRSLS